MDTSELHQDLRVWSAISKVSMTKLIINSILKNKDIKNLKQKYETKNNQTKTPRNKENEKIMPAG